MKLKQVLDGHFEKVSFDRELIKRLYEFQLKFINRNDDHLSFFSGKLMGVEVIRFTEKDVNAIFVDLLQLDKQRLSKDILNAEEINPDWSISSNYINLTFLYIAHRFNIEGRLPKKLRETGVVLAIMILHYYVITAEVSNFFRYPTTPDKAQMVYERLSKRFLIKRFNNWNEVLDHRTLMSIDLHKEVIHTLSDEKKIRYFVTNIVGSIRDIVHEHFTVLLKVNELDERVKKTTSLGSTPDGDVAFKDSVEEVSILVQKLTNTLVDYGSFYVPRDIEVVLKVVRTTRAKHLQRLCFWLVDNYLENNDSITTTLKDVIVYIHGRMNNVKYASTSLEDRLRVLKGIIGSPRTSEPALLSLRERVERLATDAGIDLSYPNICSLRTAFIIYLYLRISYI